MSERLNVISLFAGAGGLEIAACSTGVVGKILSTDSNETFLETTKINLPLHFPEVSHDAIVSDARELKGGGLVDRLGSCPDLLMGGPPCDDFTHFGRRLGLVGDKGPLIFEFLRIVDESRPRCFVFENVPNLAQQFRSVLDSFLSEAERIGYHMSWGVLAAADFGAPTMRKRVVVVGWSEEELQAQFTFPLPTHDGLNGKNSGLETHIFVRDVLSGMPDARLNGHPDYHNHTGRNHRPATVEHLKSVPQGVHVKKSYRYRAPWDGLCRSLTAGVDHSTKSYIHPIHHREMSVREYARIHGFPDSWFFCGTHHNGIKQVANAVPVPLGCAFLKQVTERLVTFPGESEGLSGGINEV